MKKIGLTGLMGLMGMVLGWATPQVSDADLKVMQVPVIAVGDSSNFHRIRISATGGTRVIYGGSNASSIDFSGFGGGSYLDFSGNATTTFSFAGLLSFLAVNTWINDLRLNDCGLNDAQLAAFVVAMGACSTSQGVISRVSFRVESNNFTTLDVSGTAVALDSSFVDFANNTTLTTVVAGNGTTTGFSQINTGTISFSGCALTNASEDSMLDADVAMETAVPGQAGVLDISGGTNAAPDTEGASDIETLVAAGWTITNN